MIYTGAVGLGGLAILAWVLVAEMQPVQWLPVLAFSALSFLVQRSSFHLGSSVQHSLAGVIDVGAILALGPTQGAIVAVVSGLSYLSLRALRHRRFSLRHWIELPLFNAGLKAAMALLVGPTYRYLGGTYPLDRLDLETGLAIGLASLLWFLVDHLGWALHDLLAGGWAGLRRFVRTFPKPLAIELPPLAFSAVVALVFVRLGWAAFGLLAVGVVIVAVLAQRWADALANQEALARQQAKLYEQERKRVRQLELIGEVSRQLTSTLELSELFQRVVHLVRDTFGYYYVSVCSVNTDRQLITFRASSSAGEEEVTYELEWGQGLVGWVAAHGEAVVVNDVASDTRYRCLEALDETKSELVTPLLLDGDVVGVLDVQSTEASTFGQDDLFILGTLGSQIALAIHEARLYEAERQQAWLSTALVQVADAMSRVSDMDDVLQSIVRLTPILAGVDRCSILLWRERSERFVPAQSYGLTTELDEQFAQLDLPEGSVPALDLVRLQKDVLLVRASDDDGLLPASLVETFGIQEVVLLPLLAQGDLLGIMMVDYAGREHHFGSRVIGMLTDIANQAAIVIQSARLVQAQREEAYVSTALLQVAEAVSRSTDLEEIMATVVRITPLLVGVEICALFLRDRATAAYLPFQQYGLRGEERSAFGQRGLPAEDPLVRELAAGSPFVDLQDLSASSQIVPVLGRDSLLVWPLAVKGEITGLMAVDLPGSAQRFTRRWMNILSGIAGQAAIAIENDRLLQEAAEQERLQQELAVAHQIQVSFLPETCPDVPGWELASVWRAARQVSGDFYDFIPLQPVPGRQDGAGRLGLVIADVADKGVPAALFMALSRTLMRTVAIDGRSPAEAMARTNDLIVADARSDLFVTLFYAILTPDSGRIIYASAGHVPSLLVRGEDGRVEEMRNPNLPLGILSSVEHKEHTLALEPGDSLVLYTDGVTEATNSAQEMYGLERLQAVLANHSHEPASRLAGAIDRSVSAYAGGAAQFDDFTLVVAKFTG